VSSAQAVGITAFTLAGMALALFLTREPAIVDAKTH